MASRVANVVASLMGIFAGLAVSRPFWPGAKEVSWSSAAIAGDSQVMTSPFQQPDGGLQGRIVIHDQDVGHV
ncbi:hypothetical protein EDE08_12452 [Bradyrhizobium sp. R2.2-H]|jgi:hypothetical protein|nr:hypothetical protein EDE10_12352 [Bradyrhizobium sp. Y-H1]TCU64220.1 hypothetical protein EDE08_12452 [Bradyrhizobium sp. R2.2-H]